MAAIQFKAVSYSAQVPPVQTLIGVEAGNLLWFATSSFNTNANVLPTDSSGQTWTQAYGQTNGIITSEFFYLLNANAGTHNLTWTQPGTSFVSIAYGESQACSAIDVTGTPTNGSGTITTLTAGSINTTFANDEIFAILSNNDNPGIANTNVSNPPSGYNAIFAQTATNSFVGCSYAWKDVTSTGSNNAVWTFTAGSSFAVYVATVVSFKRSAISSVPTGTYGKPFLG